MTLSRRKSPLRGKKHRALVNATAETQFRQWNSTLPAPKKSITRKAMKKRGRSAAESSRIYGDDYGDYIRSLPCYFCHRTPSVQAHLKAKGTGLKDDAPRTLPMCPSNPLTGHVGCHEQYDGAKRSFPASHGTSQAELIENAEGLYAEWLEARR